MINDLRLNGLKLSKGIVYHYTTAFSLINIIENNTFWVTKKDFLNDISEISYPRSIREKLMNKFDPQNQELLDIFSSWDKSEYFILSLSTEKDNLTLWSEYCSNEGYCLGFDINKLENYFQDCQIPFLHGKVIYNEVQQKVMIQEETDYLNDLFTDANLLKRLNSEFEDFAKAMSQIDKISSFFKKQVFHSENEYRFVFQVQSKKKRNKSYLSKQGWCNHSIYLY